MGGFSSVAMLGGCPQKGRRESRKREVKMTTKGTFLLRGEMRAVKSPCRDIPRKGSEGQKEEMFLHREGV